MDERDPNGARPRDGENWADGSTDRVDYGRVFVIGSGLAIREAAARADAIGGSVELLGANSGEPGSPVRRARLIGAADEVRRSVASFRDIIQQLDAAVVLLEQMAASAFPTKESAE